MPETFFATKARVLNRGKPPDSFLNELVEWGRSAPADIFSPRPETKGKPDLDIYAQVNPFLGPWHNLLHRRAAMLDLLV